MTNSIEQAWDLAKQRFAAVGVDVDAALTRLDTLRSPCTAGKAMMSPVLRIPMAY